MGELQIRYSDKSVSPWGGMYLLKEFMDRSGIFSKLEELDLPRPGSNAGYSPIEILQGFWLGLFVGASRYVHLEWLRGDETLKEIFNLRRFPSQSTYSRFFHKFGQGRNHRVFPSLQHWFFSQIDVGSLSVDLDSSVLTRYGEQEGAAVGYNPSKPGRPSHHPIMAFVSETRMVANAWMRPGNTAALSGIEGFLQETFDDVLKDHPIGLVRADSGFYSQAFLEWLEARDYSYIVAVRFYENLKYLVGGLTQWSEVVPGLEVCNVEFQPLNGKKRKYVVVRKRLDTFPKAAGKRLFDDPTYRYSLFVSNLRLPAIEIFRLYNGRADAENRIKELKYDFGADNFCLKDFFATEASFRFSMVAYNLLALFRHQVLQSGSRLSTLRAHCFAIGSWITHHANQRVLNLSVSKRKRSWMDGLFAQVRQTAPPYRFVSEKSK